MPKRKSLSVSADTVKKPRGPTLLQRVKELKGSDGVSAYKWAKERASDHVVHTDLGNVKLFDKYPPPRLMQSEDAELIAAIEFYTLARDQYLAFFSGSTSR